MPFTNGFTQWLDENVDKFYELHNHSDFSNLRLKDATNKLDRMVKYVRELGMKGMALTDHESLSGHVKFIKLIKELRKEDPEKWNDFKYVLGNEIYLTSQDLMQQQREQGYIKFYHFILLAKDGKGHEQLRRLSSIAWKKNSFNYKGMDRVPTYYSDIEEVIGEDKGHLIATSACCGSYIGQGILEILNENPSMEEQEKIKDDIYDYLMWCQDTFGEDNFYIEMQPSDQEGYQFVNEFLLRIAKACNIPFIFTTDAHYLNRDERQIHKAFLTSDEDGNGNREVDSFYGTTYFMDVYELCDRLNYLSEDDLKAGILNTKKIADSVEEYDLYHPQIVPKIPLPDENTWWHNEKVYNCAKKYEYIKKMIESEVPYDRYLADLTLKGWYEKTLHTTHFNFTMEEKLQHLERVNIEFKEILGGSEVKGDCVSAYFITEVKNIDIIWEDAEAILGTSRGSCMGFITNYYLGISQVSPLDHNEGLEMPHWRFITADRLLQDFPDIDIDLPSHKADKVFQCLENYYESIGGGIVKVGTFKTETAKSAIQTACRGLGINNDIGIYLSSLIPVERGFVRDLKTCYYGNEEKEIKPITEFKNIIDEHENLLSVALGIEGLISGRGVHACFDEDTLIMTKKGYERIKNIKIGDEVLTHKNRFKKVINTIITESNDIYSLKATSTLPIKVTGNHPLLVKESFRENNKPYNTLKFKSPQWKKVEDIRKGVDYIGIPVNQIEKIPTSNFKLPFSSYDFWWIIGRYIGDGWTEHYDRRRKRKSGSYYAYEENRVIICCSKVKTNEVDDITEKLNNIKFNYRVEESRTTYKIHIKNKDLYYYLQQFGKYAYGKRLTDDVFNLPIKLCEGFLIGWESADGDIEKNNTYRLTTISKELAVGSCQLIAKIYHKTPTYYINKPKDEYIESRLVHSKEKYRVIYYKDKRLNEQAFYENGVIWTRVKKIQKLSENKKMYNLTVEDDHTYIANNAIVHNCGQIPMCYKEYEHNAVMKAPNGELITQFDLSDAEYMGGIKYDFLKTKACAMIQICLELLLKYNEIEWQGTLRKTYDKYLHPDVLDRYTPDMWKMLDTLIGAFQFDSPVGSQALAKIHPSNLIELTAGNTLMRLMAEDGKEQPMDMYIRYKNDINEWYKDMREYGLNEKEIEILKDHLLIDNGVCATQESMMLLVMDKEISDFSVKESNKLRKSVAKVFGVLNGNI